MDLKKSSYKDVGDAVGMPDAADKLKIEQIIAKYNNKYPGEIIALREYAREYSSAGKNEYGLVNGKDKKGISSESIRYVMELPPKLYEQLEAYIPTLFRSKKHFAWFCKHFKYLMIPGKH